MNARVEKAHEIVDEFQSFVNSHKTGHCKNWKAMSILVTIAYQPQMPRVNIENYIKNCLEMEGFRASDCVLIANWVDENMNQ